MAEENSRLSFNTNFQASVIVLLDRRYDVVLIQVVGNGKGLQGKGQAYLPYWWSDNGSCALSLCIGL